MELKSGKGWKCAFWKTSDQELTTAPLYYLSLQRRESATSSQKRQHRVVYCPTRGVRCGFEEQEWQLSLVILALRQLSKDPEEIINGGHSQKQLPQLGYLWPGTFTVTATQIPDCLTFKRLQLAVDHSCINFALGSVKRMFNVNECGFCLVRLKETPNYLWAMSIDIAVLILQICLLGNFLWICNLYFASWFFIHLVLGPCCSLVSLLTTVYNIRHNEFLTAAWKADPMETEELPHLNVLPVSSRAPHRTQTNNTEEQTKILSVLGLSHNTEWERQKKASFST